LLARRQQPIHFVTPGAETQIEGRPQFVASNSGVTKAGLVVEHGDSIAKLQEQFERAGMRASQLQNLPAGVFDLAHPEIAKDKDENQQERKAHDQRRQGWGQKHDRGRGAITPITLRSLLAGTLSAASAAINHLAFGLWLIRFFVVVHSPRFRWHRLQSVILC
jgi:hypothetical protein